MKATDPQAQRPSLQRLSLHRALSHQLPSFCYSSPSRLSSCPPFLQPGLRACSLPLASPLPPQQAGLISSPWSTVQLLH